jgi:hypothetical protein
MKRIGLISLALVLALGTLGVAYAMWYDTLEIEGTISTGEVIVKFDSQYDNDPETGANDPCEEGEWIFPVDGDPYWYGGRYNKDYASVGSTYNNPLDGKANHKATITVLNAYPSYWASVLWDIKNVGLVPVKLWSVTLTELSIANDPVWQGEIALNISERYYVDADAPRVDKTLDSGDDFSFILSAYECDQIDPWVDTIMEDKGYVDVTVHLEQDATQKTLYDFTIDYVFAQWNEDMVCEPPGPA